jgi:4'-phosphopantetheinyl transferase
MKTHCSTLSCENPRLVTQLPIGPKIGHDEIHVWYVDLAAERRGAEAWPRLLSEAERERGNRFHFERDRFRFFGAHAALRRILSTYVDASPEALIFGEGAFGKPFITHPATLLRFSASHSGEIAAFAVAGDVDVGIDVEITDRHIDDVQSLAESCFSAAERDVLASAPAAERHLLFLRGWTRKEACVKATGKGLQVPLDGVSVSLHEDAPHAVRAADDPRAWTAIPLHPGPGAVAAVVATSQRAWLVRERWWPV